MSTKYRLELHLINLSSTQDVDHTFIQTHCIQKVTLATLRFCVERFLWQSIIRTLSSVVNSQESVSLIPEIIVSIAIGRLCEKCDGKCVICDSYVRPCTLVRICDECNYGSYQGRCVICGGTGVSDAYYCRECTIMEKDVSLPLQCLTLPSVTAVQK